MSELSQSEVLDTAAHFILEVFSDPFFYHVFEFCTQKLLPINSQFMCFFMAQIVINRSQILEVLMSEIIVALRYLFLQR
jgi:hypothetical protein